MTVYQRYRKLLLLVAFFLLLIIIYSLKQRDRIVLLVRIQNDFIPTPKNSSDEVLTMVLTSEKTLVTRGLAVWNTWGQSFKNIIFACTCPNIIAIKNLIEQQKKLPPELRDYEKAVDIPVLHMDLEESSSKMGEKVLAVLKNSYDIYKNYSKWYFMIDDDSYVFVDNLNKFVKTKNSSLPFMYGFKFKHLPLPGGHIGGKNKKNFIFFIS